MSVIVAHATRNNSIHSYLRSVLLVLVIHVTPQILDAVRQELNVAPHVEIVAFEAVKDSPDAIAPLVCGPKIQRRVNDGGSSGQGGAAPSAASLMTVTLTMASVNVLAAPSMSKIISVACLTLLLKLALGRLQPARVVGRCIFKLSDVVLVLCLLINRGVAMSMVPSSEVSLGARHALQNHERHFLVKLVK